MVPAFKPYEGNEPYIFISYSHKDSADVFPILQALHERGLRIWYDMGIDPGSEWPEEIANHLLSCGLFLLFMSPEAAESHNVRREITMAIDKKKPLMNVYIKETELQPGLQLQLNLIQYVSYSREAESFEDFIDRLSAILLKKAPGIAGDCAPPRAAQIPPPPPNTMPKQQGAAKRHHSKLPVFILSGAIALLAIVLAVIFLNYPNNRQEVPPGDVSSAQVPQPELSEGDSLSEQAAWQEQAEPPNQPHPSQDGGASDLAITVSGSNCYITLTGTASLKFTNIFPDKLTMPEMITRLNVNYVVLDKDGEVTDYRYNERNLPGAIEAGNSVIVSPYDASATTDFYFPVELLDTAITVEAGAAPAVYAETLSGDGNIQFANVSQESWNSPKRAANSRIEYAVYDSDRNLVDYGSNDTSHPALNSGERVVISLTDTSKPVEFFFPEMWRDSVLTVSQGSEHALRYISVTGTESVTFTNISDLKRNAIKSVRWTTRIDYVIYDNNGNIISYDASATGLEALEPGYSAKASVSNPSETTTFYYAAETVDKVYEIRESSEPALHFVALTGDGRVEFVNISGEDIGVPGVDRWTERRNYVIYDADGNEVESRENSTSHGNRLNPGSKLQVSLVNTSNSVSFYFPAEWLDTVFAVSEG